MSLKNKIRSWLLKKESAPNDNQPNIPPHPQVLTDQYLPVSDPNVARLSTYVTQINDILATACKLAKQSFYPIDIHELTRVEFVTNPPTKAGRPPRVFEKATFGRDSVSDNAMHGNVSLDPAGKVLGLNVTAWKARSVRHFRSRFHPHGTSSSAACRNTAELCCRSFVSLLFVS